VLRAAIPNAHAQLLASQEEIMKTDTDLPGGMKTTILFFSRQILSRPVAPDYILVIV
jgi:hypothetical protein